jgi:hypothetical protein
MRRLIIASVIVSLLVSMTPATAAHRPNADCSETGDICQSTTKIDGVRRLRIATAANYFDRYKLCVKPPDGTATCETFNMHERSSGIWVGSVRWAQQFPRRGPGAYSVTWKFTSGDRIGRTLGFHVR